MARYLPIFLSLMMIGSCATPQIMCIPIDLPNRPILITTPDQVWSLTPLEAQDIWTNNDLSLKAYIKRLEGRIRVYNDMCEK